MISIGTSRPRNVDWPRAAAILYGDLGTSKAYVIGLAFAVAGYSSFWLLLPMCILTTLVGINYMTICRLYPNGGGVYASARHRSEVLSIVGAFLLIADYLVTAALSALSAFQYLGVPKPAYCAGAAIVIIGFLNFFGPRKTAFLAILISIPTALIVLLISIFALPHIGAAVAHLQPLHGSFGHSWISFVGMVLALSGIEAVANTTGIMKLDPGSSLENPVVKKTSTKAIFVVLLEVVFFTAFLGLLMLALKGLTIVHGDVNAPGAEGVRDYMLRYMGEIFVGNILGTHWGILAGCIISIAFALLLLSAVNTAIIDLIAICFLMSKDQELPPFFSKLNQFGVPHFSLIPMTLIPAALVISIGDIAALANLYAIGVIGAIATNLGSTSTDWKLPMLRRERLLMLMAFVVLLAIEITLFIEKPNARIFVVTTLAIGLILRGLAKEYGLRKEVKEMSHSIEDSTTIITPSSNQSDVENRKKPSSPPILVAVKTKCKTLDYALRESDKTGSPLYVLFIRQQPIITSKDKKRNWQKDKQAKALFESLDPQMLGKTIFPCYVVSDSPKDTILEMISTLGAESLIVGPSRRNGLIRILRENLIESLSKSLPENIDLVVCG
jgi:amino acid transporter